MADSRRTLHAWSKQAKHSLTTTFWEWHTPCKYNSPITQGNSLRDPRLQQNSIFLESLLLIHTVSKYLLSIYCVWSKTKEKSSTSRLEKPVLSRTAMWSKGKEDEGVETWESQITLESKLSYTSHWPLSLHHVLELNIQARQPLHKVVFLTTLKGEGTQKWWDHLVPECKTLAN